MQIEGEATRHGVERDREDVGIVVHLEINGEAGNVTFRDSLQDCELRSRSSGKQSSAKILQKIHHSNQSITPAILSH